ncbi:hypothetical protein AVEN_54836-1, partial [Araneus ventricosus]
LSWLADSFMAVTSDISLHPRAEHLGCRTVDMDASPETSLTDNQFMVYGLGGHSHGLH